MAGVGDAGDLDSFDVSVRNLDQFGKLLCDVIDRLLTAEGINTHSIDYRVKTRESATRKIRRKSDRYDRLEDLTDLLGLRIITYYSDEVDRAAEVIEAEFSVDRLNSVDKRAALDPDRFGYVSLHYVLSMGESRVSLREYKRFASISFELQIRSILQHAWAEIEHDLGYKTASAIPKQIRRRFSRLAGLLEMADDEFAHIRALLSEYSEKVNRVPESELRDLELNKSTLTAYVVKDEELKAIDESIALMFPAGILSAAVDSTLGGTVQMLTVMGVGTISKLDEMLRVERANVLSLAREWITRTDSRDEPDVEHYVNNEPTTRGISLFYLWYLLLTRASEKTRIEQLDEHWPGDGAGMSVSLMAAAERASRSGDAGLPR